MPFALTILKRNIKNISIMKNFECNYMTMSFDTKNNFEKLKPVVIHMIKL